MRNYRLKKKWFIEHCYKRHIDLHRLIDKDLAFNVNKVPKND
jgi:hypothetical protein